MCFVNLCWNNEPHPAEQSGIKASSHTQPAVLGSLAFPEHLNEGVPHALSTDREDLQPHGPPFPASKEAVCKPSVNHRWEGLDGVLFLQAVPAAQGLGCLWVICASSRSVGAGGTVLPVEQPSGGVLTLLPGEQSRAALYS